jgi:predicted esterase
MIKRHVSLLHKAFPPGRVLLCLAVWGVLVWLWVPLLPYHWGTPFREVEREIKVGQQTRTYYLVVPPSLPPGAKVPLVFFLQGFDAPGEPSLDSLDLYARIAAKARQYFFIAVFPRGHQGSFPEVPQVRAWYPEHVLENRYFLVKLCKTLQETLPVDESRVIWGGYSNGAYMGAIELLSCPSSPFTHFYLNSGGYPYGIKEPTPRKKVFLSAGVHDEHNLVYVKILNHFLTKHGWTKENLKVSFFEGAHVYHPESFDEMWEFFFGPGR